MLSWPKGSFWFFCTILPKNPNELFGQLIHKNKRENVNNLKIMFSDHHFNSLSYFFPIFSIFPPLDLDIQ